MDLVLSLKETSMENPRLCRLCPSSYVCSLKMMTVDVQNPAMTLLIPHPESLNIGGIIVDLGSCRISSRVWNMHGGFYR